MTDKEKAIVMAYTGVCMLSGDKFKIFHEYVENIMGRPVYTHEMVIKAIDDEIKEKAKTNFIALCAEQEQTVCDIDAIRAEIADLDDADYDYEGYYKAVTDALQIIDKYTKNEKKGRDKG